MSRERRGAIGFDGVLEGVLYYPPELEEATRRFYGDTLGLDAIGSKPGEFLFFRAGRSVVLLFVPEQSARKDSPPPHGARGPGHLCLLAGPGAYEAWKERLTEAGHDVEAELDWPRGGRSFYFRDPAGNALEIADRDIWPS